MWKCRNFIWSSIEFEYLQLIEIINANEYKLNDNNKRFQRNCVNRSTIDILFHFGCLHHSPTKIKLQFLFFFYFINIKCLLVVCVLCVLACNGQFTSFAGFFLIWWSWKDIVRSNSNLLNVNVCVLFACTQRVFVNACCPRTRTSDIKPLVHLFTWI